MKGYETGRIFELIGVDLEEGVYPLLGESWWMPIRLLTEIVLVVLQKRDQVSVELAC